VFCPGVVPARCRNPENLTQPVNLAARIGVSILVSAGIWLASFLLERHLRLRLAEAGIDWPAEDIGIEVSPGLMRAIAITDLLHRIRFVLPGSLFVILLLITGN